MYRSFKNFELENFNCDLVNAPFHVGSIFDDANDQYWYFNSLYSTILNEHAPIKSKKVRPSQPVFMNSKLRKAVYKKSALRRKFQRFPSKLNWETYRKQRNFTTKIRKESIKDYFQERCTSLKDKDCKTFHFK